MRKWLGYLMALCVAILPVAAFAQEAEEVVLTPAEETAPASDLRAMMLPGTVTAGRTVTVLAPFGGMLEEVLVKKGDLITARDTMFTLATTKVYAPCDGVVGTVGAKVGDEADFLKERYGAVLYIEPESQLVVKTDTKNAYSTDMMVHVGEVVYIGSKTSAERVGIGFVTTVSGKSYTVEVTGGNLLSDENIVLYRDKAFAETSKIGTGKTERNANVAVVGSGVLFSVGVTQGQRVSRGDLLFETVSGTSQYNPFPTARVLSGYDAVVASVDASVGANVSQRQVLATLSPLDGFTISATALESELKNVVIGSAVRVELATAYGGHAFSGTVRAISGLSDASGDEPEYSVLIDFAADDWILLGMNVNVYFNE